METGIRFEMRKTILAAALAFVTLSSALAQTQRIAGTIERMTQDGVIVKPIAGGDNFDIMLAEKLTVFGVSKAQLSDIKPGVFIGVGATPRLDGSQRAIQVTMFTESQRGLGEGHRPWDRAPNGTMTNGTVNETVASVDGPVLTVKYKDGEKKIVVPSDATILGYSPGDRSELKPGVRVAISGARKRADGKFEADRVNVGRGDVVLR
jgi:hypothetical protein